MHPTSSCSNSETDTRFVHLINHDVFYASLPKGDILSFDAHVLVCAAVTMYIRQSNLQAKEPSITQSRAKTLVYLVSVEGGHLLPSRYLITRGGGANRYKAIQ